MPPCLHGGMIDAVIGGGGSGMVAPWLCVIVVDLCDLDFDVVVENGHKKTLRTDYVYDVGISNNFWGGTISLHWMLNLGSNQGVLEYHGLWGKVCPIRLGALRDQTTIHQTSGPSLSRVLLLNMLIVRQCPP